jgi:hypothetical protein
MSPPAAPGLRYFVGIGVGTYEDSELDLPSALGDVERIEDWFVSKSGREHVAGAVGLRRNPTAHQIVDQLGAFLSTCTEDDVAVVWFACHGEFEGDRAYLYGKDTPREGLAGRAVDADVIGRMIGQSQVHNVLLISTAHVPFSPAGNPPR